jgi:hypothetical protein
MTAMKTQLPEPDDARLRDLLRASHPAPDLPPGFQNAVWRRLERAEKPGETESVAEWLDRAAAWLLRPRLALVGVAAMLLVGISIGVLQGTSLANDIARQQYLAAVSPLTTR